MGGGDSALPNHEIREKIMKDLSKNISLHCVVCGNDQFSTVEDSIEDMKKEAMREFEKKLKKMSFK